MDYFDDIKEKYFMFSCKTKHFFSVLLPGGARLEYYEEDRAVSSV